MKTTIEVELEPFQVPNFARSKRTGRTLEDMDGMDQTYHLSELSPEALDRLCREFRASIFRKSGKQQPPENRQP